MRTQKKNTYTHTPLTVFQHMFSNR
jgi:hypothetical protein